MRVRPTISRLAGTLAVCVGGVLLTGACQLENGQLVFGHSSKDQRAQAQERWDDVRSDVKLRLAREHLEGGRIDEAEDMIEQAVVLAPDNPQAYLLATRLRIEQGQLAEARQAITMAASISQDDPEIEYFAGIVAQRYGDLEGALKHYAAAAARAPNTAPYLLAKAETLVALGRPADALEFISPRIYDFDDNVPLRMLAARTSRMLQLRGPTAEHCREALRLRGDDPTLQAEAGMLLVWAEQYEEAITILQPLAEQLSEGDTASTAAHSDCPDVPSPALLNALAWAFLATEQPREAQRTSRLIMNDREHGTVACCIYARAALMLDDLEAAARAMAMARQKSPAAPETLLLAAYVAMRSGDHAAVWDAAQAALELDGRLVPALCLAGQAASAMGRDDRALGAYLEALELDPTSRIARTLLQALRSRMTVEEDISRQAGPEVRAGLEARRWSGLDDDGSARVLPNVGNCLEPHRPVLLGDGGGRWTVSGNEASYIPGNQ
jgi:tetratricopeptide (TPR) repeat protein